MPPKKDRSRGSSSQKTEKRGTIVGKFTTSVKKFVQDVESDHTKDAAIQIFQRIKLVEDKVNESYVTVKSALAVLRENYDETKSEKNVIRKYSTFKAMIKEVIKLDTQYWVLIDLPKQQKHEQVATYVMRCWGVLEKLSNGRAEGKSSATKSTEEDPRQAEIKRLEGLSISEIDEENKNSIEEVYRLIKKYNNLREILHELKVNYMDSKLYPFLPRYVMLKDMIKAVLRDPNYMEICHEDLIAETNTLC